MLNHESFRLHVAKIIGRRKLFLIEGKRRRERKKKSYDSLSIILHFIPNNTLPVLSSHPLHVETHPIQKWLVCQHARARASPSSPTCSFARVRCPCTCVGPPSRERGVGEWDVEDDRREAEIEQSGTEIRRRGPLGSTDEETWPKLEGGCEKDAYTQRGKHKGGWLGASERAGIRGGPSYIDFCPRHHHPRRSLRNHPCEPPHGAGGGSGRLQVWGRESKREGAREMERWKKRWNGWMEGKGQKGEGRKEPLSLCARRTFDGRGPRGWHSVTFNPRHPLLPPHSNNRHRRFGG